MACSVFDRDDRTSSETLAICEMASLSGTNTSFGDGASDRTEEAAAAFILYDFRQL